MSDGDYTGWAKPMCVTGCGQRGRELHHVVYAQHCRVEGASRKDERNLVAVCRTCHAAHHSRRSPILVAVLPDSVFEFAVEVYGHGRALGYLRRRYGGEDARLDVLEAAIERREAA